MKRSKLEKRAKSNRLKIVPFGSLGWTQSRDELTLAQASETDFQRRKKGHILGVGKQSEWKKEENYLLLASQAGTFEVVQTPESPKAKYLKPAIQAVKFKDKK